MHNAADDSQRDAWTVPLLPAEGPVLPLLGTVIYPQTVTPLAISQPAAVQLVDEVLQVGDMLTLVALRAERVRPPTTSPEHCYTIGTIAVIHRLLRLPDNTLRIAAEGVARVRLDEWRNEGAHLYAHFAPLPDQPSDPQVVQALVARAVDLIGALGHYLPVITDEFQIALANDETPERLSYLLGTTLAAHSSVAERQALLQLPSVAARLERLCQLAHAELERAQQIGTGGEAREQGAGTLERRPELRELPLVREARAEGRGEGMRAAALLLLRDRFGDDALVPDVVARLAQLRNQEMLERAVVQASRAMSVDAFMAAL